MKEGIYTHIDTNKGTITLALHYDKTPGTVGNFVGLAEGKIANDQSDKDTPYYDGLTFHRVIADFMIPDSQQNELHVDRDIMEFGLGLFLLRSMRPIISTFKSGVSAPEASVGFGCF